MYGRYSLVKRAKKKINSWDLNFEEIERGVVKVVPRKPTPLFSPAVEKEKNYVHAMNVPAPRPPRPPLTKKGEDGGKKFGLGRKVVDPTKKQVEVPETTSSSSSISAKTYSPHPPQSSPVRKRKNKKQKKRKLMSETEEIIQQVRITEEKEEETTTTIDDDNVQDCFVCFFGGPVHCWRSLDPNAVCLLVWIVF